jgi:hypothetical protein
MLLLHQSATTYSGGSPTLLPVLKVQSAPLSAGERSRLWLFGRTEMPILEAAMWTPEDRVLVLAPVRP